MYNSATYNSDKCTISTAVCISSVRKVVISNSELRNNQIAQ